MPRAQKQKSERGAAIQAIREYLKEHPRTLPSEVAAALTEHGFETTIQQVYGVRSNDKRRKNNRRLAKAAAKVQMSTYFPRSNIVK